MPAFKYTQLIYTVYEPLFIIAMVLLVRAFKSRKSAAFSPLLLARLAFPFLVLIAAYLSARFSGTDLVDAIALIFIFITWLIVIKPLWSTASKIEKRVACVLSYPGQLLFGGWPLTLAPGVLTLPFGLWLPAPGFSIVLSNIGNSNGFKSSLIIDIFSLFFWASLFIYLFVFSDD